jgi:hypothetical protein
MEEKIIGYKGYNSIIYSFSFSESISLLARHPYSNDKRSNVAHYLIFPVLSLRIFITCSLHLSQEVSIFSLNFMLNTTVLVSSEGSQLTGPQVGSSRNASNFYSGGHSSNLCKDIDS